MSEKGLSFAEVALLVILMVEREEVSNPDLKERYGVTLDGAARRKLNDLKLVESRKQGRAFAHLLTDDGWARVAEEIKTGIPMPRGAAGAMNLALVSMLRGFLARTGQSLADFFLPVSDPAALSPATDPEVPDLDPDPEAEPGVGPEPGAGPEARVEDGAGAEDGRGDVEVTARIRAAYAELAAEPGAWVSLARLRPLLDGFARAEVDAALKGMIHLPEVSIVPENNQKVLTPEARAAAVTIGEQDKHLISIGVR